MLIHVTLSTRGIFVTQRLIEPHSQSQSTVGHRLISSTDAVLVVSMQVMSMHIHPPPHEHTQYQIPRSLQRTQPGSTLIPSKGLIPASLNMMTIRIKVPNHALSVRMVVLCCVHTIPVQGNMIQCKHTHKHMPTSTKPLRTSCKAGKVFFKHIVLERLAV